MVGEKNISGNSVIYNVSKDMFMIMDKLLFQVSWLEQDDNILGKIQGLINCGDDESSAECHVQETYDLF